MEALRGFAALLVLHCHLFLPQPDVDPGYTPPAAAYGFQAGQGAVLLFFVISGYVIGLAHHLPFTAARARDYLKRRAVRIYPLYVVAVFLGALAVTETGWRPVLTNLFLLQTPLPFFGHVVPLLKGNSNLWSLQYEAVYYVLFLAVWFGRIPLLLPWAGAVLIVGFGWLAGGWPALLVNYAAGWAYWLAGHALARAPAAGNAAPLPWPSLLLLFVATWSMKPLTLVLDRLGHAPPVSGWINLTNLEFLPVCLALLIAMTRRRPAGWRWVVRAAFVPPLLICAWQLVRGQFLQPNLLPYEMLSVVALALAWWRPAAGIWHPLAPLGAISYGVYAFQRPVQWWVHDQDWLPSGSVATFVLRIVVITVLTGLLAWAGERKLQPWLRRRLLRPAAP